MDADVVVIGSGAGGMTAAVASARAGLRVLVLEQHYLPGGWCHSFNLGGYRFSPGVHYIGELGPGGGTRRLFEGLGLGADLSFYELNPDGFEHVHVAGERFDIPRGRAVYEERLARRFPSERRGIHAYLDVLERFRAELARFTDISSAADLARAALGARTVLRWSVSTGRDLVHGHVRDPLLRAILLAQSGDHGLPPGRVSAAVHAGVASHYLDGGYYPRGGGRAIPRAFIRALEKAGGRIRVRAPVERILLEGGRAIGVRLADGTDIRARWVISNADPGVTFGKLVGREHLPSRLARKLARTRWSISAVSLFGAAELDAAALGLDSGNYWYYATPDLHDLYTDAFDPASLSLPRMPGFFLTFTTLKDPSRTYAGRQVFEAFVLITSRAFAAYEGTKAGERPEPYEALKRSLSERILASLELVVPGMRERVVFSELGTPLTNQHYLASTEGNIYGTEKTRSQIGPLGWSTRTTFPGLLLCGASTLSHGVSGAAWSGLQAARAVTGATTDELLSARGPELVTRSPGGSILPEAAEAQVSA